MPVSERAYPRLLSLPMWHGLTDSEQDRVCSTLDDALNGN
jgi:dTDP-4-amino-4,6-dideoxygalactose transaminase